MSDAANPMLSPSITKVTVNIGVGEGGRRLQLAERVLEVLTTMKPMRTISAKTNRDLGTRKGAPIGCKVTIRDPKAIETFLKDAFWVRDHTLPEYNFDAQGNLSFGISDYTDFPKQKYDPDIGIFGLDVAVAFERPGYRVARRKVASRKVGPRHRLTRDECQEYMRQNFKLEVVA